MALAPLGLGTMRSGGVATYRNNGAARADGVKQGGGLGEAVWGSAEAGPVVWPNGQPRVRQLSA